MAARQLARAAKRILRATGKKLGFCVERVESAKNLETDQGGGHPQDRRRQHHGEQG